VSRGGKAHRLAPVAALFVALVVLWPAPASAAVIRPYETNFKGAEAPGGPLAKVWGAAVDGSTGDVFLAESKAAGGPSTIERFDSDGAYAGLSFNGAATPSGSFGGIPFLGAVRGAIAAEASTGDLWVGDVLHGGLLDRFSEGGAFLCRISGRTPSTTEEEAAECDGATGSATPDGGFTPTGIALDEADGEVYVADGTHNVIDVFSTGGAYLRQISDPHIATPTAIALDSTGRLYVLDKGAGVARFSPAGSYEATVDAAGKPTALAVGPSDRLFLFETASEGAGQIAEYEDSGETLLRRFGAAQRLENIADLAVDPVTGRLYAVSAGTEAGAFVYGPLTAVPDVETGAASEIEEGSATLTGHVDPDAADGGGEVTACRFRYASEATLDHIQTLTLTGAGEFLLEFEGKQSALPLPASASAGQVREGLEKIATIGAGNVSVGGPAGGPWVIEFTGSLAGTELPGLRFISAAGELKGQVERNWSAASSAPCSPAVPYTGPQAVTAELTGLSPATGYRYRLIAENSAAIPAESEEGSFATAGAPAILAESPAIVSDHSATFTARINPFGRTTTCSVQYVTEAEFERFAWGSGATMPCSSSLSGFGSQVASAEAGALALATTYRYRFLAENEARETATGAGGSFSTFGIESFSMEALNELGEPEDPVLAGAHPYELVTRLTFASNLAEGEEAGKETASHPPSEAKDIRVELPAGFAGSAAVVPTCPLGLEQESRCPTDTQVGTIAVTVIGNPPHLEGSRAPLYNVVAPRGIADRLAGEVNGSVSAFIDSSLRVGSDYGIESASLNLSGFAGSTVHNVVVNLWGVPAATGHDPLRTCGDGRKVLGCSYAGVAKPFLTNPTSCAGPLTATVRADSYQSPGEYVEAAHQMPPVVGCNEVAFEPTIEATPTSDVADSPTGLDVDLHLPQDESPTGRGTADLRDATVTLPQGISVDPSSAAGLEGCSEAQIGYKPGTSAPLEFTPEPAGCPDASKLGTVEIDTPLLGHPLGSPGGPAGDVGAVYLAQPYANPFDSLIAIYIAVYDPETGIVIKLAGNVEVGEGGRLTTTFAENPQQPFEDFKLDFFGGARGALRSPAVCGAFTTTSSLTPWSAPESGPPATPSGSFVISQEPGGGACPTSAGRQPNSPSFEAGTESPLAGAYSPFVLHLRREDGSQEFGALDVTLPPGLTGRLAGIPYCPEADLKAAEGKTGKEEEASASCPSASEVGTVTVGAGAGPEPYYVTGHAYLGGPYKGAPLSLAIVTPAVAGPYDLGTVVVRSALEVDPYTARITVRSDPIPSELKNIPLDVRSIAVRIGRPGFTLNPTSCETMAVGGTETSTEGDTAQLTDRFQVGECGQLKFRPGIAFRLKGATHRAGHPALTATLKMPEGGANIARAQVSLPHAFFLDQGNLDNVCTQPEIAAASCPAGAIYGHATAWSPLLEKPLEGPVYLGVGYGYKLPALVAELDGQIRVLLKGRVDSDKQHGIRNTFEVVPDAPVSKFVLSLKGGKKYGLIENSEPLCAKAQRASARFVGQNGKVDVLHPRIVAACGKAKKKTPKGKGHRR
jgi:hypothetical protein